jgi:ABC-type microcin C transport system duplicated ATPase subunit YejF
LTGARQAGGATAPGDDVVLRGEGLGVDHERRDGRGRVTALDGVSLALRRGRVLGVVGESGAGKSSLARVLLCLLPGARGDVWWNGVHVSALREAQRRPLRRHVQMVGQDPRASLDPRMRIGASVEELLAVHEAGTSRSERAQRAAAALVSVGLDATGGDRGIASRFPHELSGGQAQRAVIARAIALRPDVLVCDEPVSALDVSVQAQVLNVLCRLCEQHAVAIVFVSHDLAVVRHVADDVLVLSRGRVVESAPAAQVFTAPQHPYTNALITAASRQRPAMPAATGQP